jgi:hypothetical protein
VSYQGYGFAFREFKSNLLQSVAFRIPVFKIYVFKFQRFKLLRRLFAVLVLRDTGFIIHKSSVILYKKSVLYRCAYIFHQAYQRPNACPHSGGKYCKFTQRHGLAHQSHVSAVYNDPFV